MDFGRGISQIPGTRIGLTTLSRSARASRETRQIRAVGRRATCRQERVHARYSRTSQT